MLSFSRKWQLLNTNYFTFQFFTLKNSKVFKIALPKFYCRANTTLSQELSSSDEEDDSDEVTDYLEKLNIEVTNIDLADDQESHKTSSENNASPRQVDSDGPASPMITTRLASNSEQDTISDESGYSEESNPSAKDTDLDLIIDDECDLTVKGVLISDFSPSERLKYLQRSQSTQQRAPPPVTLPQLPPPAPANPIDIFQNKVPEFCINI